MNDCIEKPDLQLRMFVAKVYFPYLGHLPEEVSLQIKNNGKKPMIVKTHEFQTIDGKKLLVLEARAQLNDKMLEPNASRSITFSNVSLLQLIEKEDQLDSFIVIDASGTEWKLPKKDMLEFKDSLRKKRS